MGEALASAVQEGASRDPTPVLLVHGGGHGAWAWRGLAAALTARGVTTITFDLPGLGADLQAPGDVTLRAYVDKTLAVLAASRAPVLLVGHSMGGAVAAQSAEYATQHVAGLIYLAGLAPSDGETMAHAPDLGPQYRPPDRQRSVGHAIISDPEAGVHRIDPEQAPGIFYTQAPPHVAAWAVAQLRPQAIAPLLTPLHLSPGRWGVVRKTYIVCSQDQAIPPSVQRGLAARIPSVSVVERPWDHSPFLSDPEGLADLLAEAAHDHAPVTSFKGDPNEERNSHY